jgi:2-succinyl-6-hydroxy-2,4-cyclohexadiene-1-carboxylate synthase
MTRILTDGVSLNVETAGAGAPLVLLHGFTGCAAGWAPHTQEFARRARVVTIDLLGHGASDAPAAPDRYRIERSAADILAVLDRLDVARATVLGYSMGGRLALFLAATAPERLRSVVLVSASPGLRHAGDRLARAAQDARLADAIERDGVAAFVDRWERHPLFATQAGLPRDVRARLRAQRLGHTARGLANSLRGMGQGSQPPLHDLLPRVRVPTLLLVGALDPAYCALGREMGRLIPGARLAIVPAAGHAVHLEQPQAFRRLVLAFLDETEGPGRAQDGGGASTEPVPGIVDRNRRRAGDGRHNGSASHTPTMR